MTSLNLRRDVGFLFHGVQTETERQALVKDLRHLFNDFSVPEEYGNFTDFQSTVVSHQGGCQGTQGWQASSILIRQVQSFFHDVEDSLQIGDQVFYDIADPAQKTPLYDGADVLVRQPENLFQMIYESYDWMPIRPEAHVGIEEGSVWTALRLSRDQVAVLFAEGIGKKEVMEQAHFLDFLEPEQMTDAIANRYAKSYIDMVQGLRREDQISILKLACDTTFVERLTCDFAIYTQDKKDKYERHRAYAEVLAQEFPDVSANLILSMVMVESNGDRTRQNGQFLGLMQVGKNEFASYVDPDLPSDVRGDATHYKAGLSAGARYLQEWCFAKFNPERRLAVAVGNYNWGCGNMRDYRQGKVVLRQETHDYLAKLLVFSRLFSGLGVR